MDPLSISQLKMKQYVVHYIERDFTFSLSLSGIVILRQFVFWKLVLISPVEYRSWRWECDQDVAVVKTSHIQLPWRIFVWLWNKTWLCELQWKKNERKVSSVLLVFLRSNRSQFIFHNNHSPLRVLSDYICAEEWILFFSSSSPSLLTKEKKKERNEILIYERTYLYCIRR